MKSGENIPVSSANPSHHSVSSSEPRAPSFLPRGGPARDAGRPGSQSGEAQTPRAPAAPGSPGPVWPPRPPPRGLGPHAPGLPGCPLPRALLCFPGAMKKTLPRKPANSPSPWGAPPSSGRPEPPVCPAPEPSGPPSSLPAWAEPPLASLLFLSHTSPAQTAVRFLSGWIHIRTEK